MAQRKQRKKDGLKFGEARANHEDIKAIEQKSANARKARNNTIDPHR
jgi:hypothetical protein